MRRVKEEMQVVQARTALEISSLRVLNFLFSGLLRNGPGCVVVTLRLRARVYGGATGWHYYFGRVWHIRCERDAWMVAMAKRDQPS